MIITSQGLLRKLKSKKKQLYCMADGHRNIAELTQNKLPAENECFKFISLTGGFGSVNFIKAVANKEIIHELTASTLRIGQKQFLYLENLYRAGKLKKAAFFIGSIMKEDSRLKNKEYDYFAKFIEASRNCGWESFVTNNHSKIILMQTEINFYVLESSSNLNENPKIEQYSFENSKELYEFYYNFFDILKSSMRKKE